MNHPTLKATSHSRSRRLPGFTLVEILTVIAIITILLAAGAIGIGNINAGKGVTSAVATCESLFEEARTIAVSKRCKARLMIHVGDKASDNYLRRVVVVREQFDKDGKPIDDTWVLASRGYVMPQGTFYSQVYSYGKGGSGTVAKETSMTLLNKDIDPDSVTPPVAPRTLPDYDGDYYYYEFNGEGIYEDAGASFVVGSGRRAPNQEPKTTKASSRDFAGFVIWRNGRTSVFRSPNQISPEIKTLPESNVEF